MAFDLEAIRKKVAQLNGGGNRNTSRIQLWKPDLGEYKIRALPWKSLASGEPFQERWFYYIGDIPGILAPDQFGKPDPIRELINKLFRSGKAEDKALAKKLLPKMRAYAPIVVRSDEQKGVQVWAFGKTVYQRLLGFFVDAEVGDILDPKDGFDLKVTISRQVGKQFNDTVVDAGRRPVPLSVDPKQAQAWLDAVPSLDDMYRLKSYEEIKRHLDEWLSGGSTPDNSSDGTSRGDDGSSELDKLADEVKGDDGVDVASNEASKQEQVAEKPKKNKKADKAVEEEKREFKDLDDAFNDLL